MNPQVAAVYEFGEFRLDIAEGRLTRNSETLRVPPKALELLTVLVSHAGRLVTKEELLAEVWPGTFVEEGNLAVTMVTIRRLLGDENGKAFIETVPRRGYRFIAPIRQVDSLEPFHEAAESATGAGPLPSQDSLPIQTHDGTGNRDPALSLSSGPGIHEAVSAPQARPPRRLLLVQATAIAAVLASGIVAGHFAWRAAPLPQPVFRQITFRRGSIAWARFSRDGTIFYSANWDREPIGIYAVRPQHPEPRPPSIENSVLTAVTPGGELGILRGAKYLHHTLWIGTLARVPEDGGAPRDILKNVLGADWDPTDPSSTRMAVVRRDPNTGAMRLEFPPGKVLYESSGWISHIRISPDGHRVAFLNHPLPNDSLGSVDVVDLSGHHKILSSGWAAEAGLAWAPPGNEVWFSATRAGSNMAIYAVSLDGRLRNLLSSAGRVILQDVSKDGRLLISSESVRSALIYSLADGTAERDLSWLDHSFRPHVSADGKELLFTEGASAAGPHYTVCLRGTDGSPVVQLGEGTAQGISPDGKWALVIVPTLPGQILLLPTGAGEARVLERGPIENYTSGAWLPDGKHVLFTGNEPAEPEHTYIQDISAGRPTRILPDGYLPLTETISPDGREVACHLHNEQYLLCPLNGGPPEAILGLAGGEVPLGWTADGGELYVADLSQLPIAVYLLNPATGVRRLWRKVTPSDAVGITHANALDIAPDGKALTGTYVRVLSQLYTVDGVK